MQQLEKVGIASRANSKVKTFSQGMKQRLGLACALINNPQLIILDEPTNGLDPQGIADVRNLILQLSKDERRTILVSSHLLSEIELIADSMLIIDKGMKVAEGKVADLLNPQDTLLELQTTDNKLAASILQQSQWQEKLKNTHEQLLLKLHRKNIPELVEFLVQKNIRIIALQPRHSLEDYFLNLTTSNQHVETYKN
jgi:ABC-type multidrug transport system ATPase subunit